MSDVTLHLASNRVDVHRNNAEPWSITLVDTGDATQTGGRLRRVLPYIKDEPYFALTYGDGLANIDINAEVEFHKAHGRLATVAGVRPPSRFGAMTVAGARVSIFAEKPKQGEGWINGGYFVLSPRVGELLADDHTVWGARSARAARARGPIARLFTRRLLAADGYAA
ncbi:MAG: sugar phosphate nucleotidyltransferase [Hyphomicrobium sp.]|nr:sugar phosphate nucleotidyltransferase [Hyphomicrobium sp.]